MSIVEASVLANIIGMEIKNRLELINRSDMVTFLPSIIFIYKIHFSFPHRHKQG
jgi:hypothetical protein